MNTEERELVKKIREAEKELVLGIEKRNAGMTAYRKAQKKYSELMAQAAKNLMEKK